MKTSTLKTVPRKAPAANEKNRLSIPVKRGENAELNIATVGLSGIVGNATTAINFAQPAFGSINLEEAVGVLAGKARKVQAGNLSELEGILTAQVTALDAIFNELARRAAMNMGEHLQATDIYLRQAFKAQAQCRSTVEALAEIKNPRPLAFVKQANISHGHQQVNNGVTTPPIPAHGNIPIQSNELSGEKHELLPDARASRLASRVDTTLEALGEIHRGKNTGGQSGERKEQHKARSSLA